MNKEDKMKVIKVLALNAALISAAGPSIAQLNGTNSLLGSISSVPAIGGLLGTVTELPIVGGLLDPALELGGIDSLPLINLSPLLALENGVPIVERLPVITRIPVVGELLGDGKGQDPISLIGEVLGLEVLPLTFLFDGSIPF
jgi:hypothetical protein